MNTVACYKITPDNQDVAVAPDGSIDLAHGGEALGDTKLVKAALSRGASELYSVSDPALADADAFQTATVLAATLGKMEYDLVICGEGSADRYEQQVGSLLGSLLGLPVVNAVSSIEPRDGSVVVERALENEVEVLEVALPAVVSVTTDINLPRIPQLKDILAAGKKPVTTWTLDEVGGLSSACVETVSVKAPGNVERKKVVYESGSAENVGELAANIRASL